MTESKKQQQFHLDHQFHVAHLIPDGSPTGLYSLILKKW